MFVAVRSCTLIDAFIFTLCSLRQSLLHYTHSYVGLYSQQSPMCSETLGNPFVFRCCKLKYTINRKYFWFMYTIVECQPFQTSDSILTSLPAMLQSLNIKFLRNLYAQAYSKLLSDVFHSQLILTLEKFALCFPFRKTFEIVFLSCLQGCTS